MMNNNITEKGLDISEYISEFDIAIIGMSGRFPGAKNLDEFWNNIASGKESISHFQKNNKVHRHVPAFGAIDDIDLFDSAFFGLTPQEAEKTDPQHRLFLECCYEAFENAGYYPKNIKGIVGIFAGTSMSTYIMQLIDSSKPATMDTLQLLVGNDKDYLTTRVAYKLSLKGPAISVQTACSTSLVAIVMACQSLLQHQIDYAIAGGVSITTPQNVGYQYVEGGIFSPDGHCRAFDSKAQGTVPGNGVGAVVLKRALEAINDGDNIVTIIKGFAVNNDGSEKIGYTAPGIAGQAEVIMSALSSANINPSTISYIEAHGTGTSLGDPVEISAIKKAFGKNLPQRCAIGSIKSNIGHLNTAAGIASFIKLCLMLENRVIPKSINFEEPSPQLNLENSPFYIPKQTTKWEGDLLRGGLSSFGFGGTNAHIVLESPPKKEVLKRFFEDKNPAGAGVKERDFHIIPISAKTRTALDEMTKNIMSFIEKNSLNKDNTEYNDNIPSIAYTMQVGREHFNHKRALLIKRSQNIEPIDSRILNTSNITNKSEFIFLFSGQGTQYVNMGIELFEKEKVFRESLKKSSRFLKELTGENILELVYPSLFPSSFDSSKNNYGHLGHTVYAQPAIVAIEIAMAMLLISYGVKPSLLIGHSVGEISAAHIAGVLSLEDTLLLTATRAKLMQSQPFGLMIAVNASFKELDRIITEKLSIAAINNQEQCVVSGNNEDIESFEKRLKQLNFRFSRLKTSHAFHSQMMDPILASLDVTASSLKHSKPIVPFISNVTGSYHNNSPLDPSYWSLHARNTVNFDKCISTAFSMKSPLFIEIGPGKTLSAIISQHSIYKNSLQTNILHNTMKAHDDINTSDEETLLSLIGNLWSQGADINWLEFQRGLKKMRMPLPTYPFQRKRYWIGADNIENNSRALDSRTSNDSCKSNVVDEEVIFDSNYFVDVLK